MKILFITKPYLIDPLGIASLSAALKKDGHKTFILRTLDIHGIDILNEIKEIDPDVLAYNVYTGSHNFFKDLNINLRIQLESDVLSVFGGPHCTFFKEFYNNLFVDAIFQGECDFLFPEILPKLKELIKGEAPLIFKDERNPQNLDSLPFPDRDLIYQFPENKNNPIKNIMTSRGCPFQCSYCFNYAYNKMFKGRPLRYRSVDNVMEEVKQLVYNYPQTKFIFFEDDEFAMDLSRLKEFNKKWKIAVDLPFHVQLRIDLLTESRIRELKQAGCVSVTFAIESGNEHRRMKLLNRAFTNKTILKGAKLLRKYKIKFRTENMIAQPGETIREVMETLDINIKCRSTIAWSSLFQPYPGTQIGDQTIKDGLFCGDLDKIPSSFFEKTVLDIPDKIKFENLQRIFGIICGIPALRLFVPLLIRVPPNKFYDFIYKWWKNRMYNKLYAIPREDIYAGKRKKRIAKPCVSERINEETMVAKRNNKCCLRSN